MDVITYIQICYKGGGISIQEVLHTVDALVVWFAIDQWGGILRKLREYLVDRKWNFFDVKG